MEFQIIRNCEYFTLCNYHLNDRELSLQSKGLLSIMLSLPKNWDYSIKGLVELCNTTNYEITKILSELENRKYLIRKKVQNDKGQFEFLYQIFEKPYTEIDGMDGAKPYHEIDGMDDHLINYSINSINTNIKNIGKNTNIDICTNTNILGENKEKNTQKRKKEVLSEKSKNDTPKTSTQMFEEIWKMYPRKIGKKKSFDYFIKALKTTDFETIKKGVENYTAYIKRNNITPSYIKHGSTWFFQQCWNDDYSTTRNLNEPYWLDDYYQSIGEERKENNNNNNSTTNQQQTIEELEKLFNFKK